MKYYYYICVHRYLIPDEIMEKYNLKIEPDSHMYFKTSRGMYGLKEYRIISLKQIV